MTLQIVGAGLGRTGTHTLKLALERLMGAPCYHMFEVFGHPEHVPMWHAAMINQPLDWSVVFDGFVATVDWPGGGVWEDIWAAYPDAKVLLSTRQSTDQWWRSASRTIFLPRELSEPGQEPWQQMIMTMMKRFTPAWPDEVACKAAYEAHNGHVRATVPKDRLIDWKPEDGWGPLCDGLGVPVPDEPFPLTNTTEEFRSRMGLGES